mmetsp:Transcript_8423/g.21577  ORF Transcript_8423/g.21577 Transcript_8423/m.21577 type:complete len:281 (+) Transcript_8423:786-1628(+)
MASSLPRRGSSLIILTRGAKAPASRIRIWFASFLYARLDKALVTHTLLSSVLLAAMAAEDHLRRHETNHDDAGASGSGTMATRSSASTSMPPASATAFWFRGFSSARFPMAAEAQPRTCMTAVLSFASCTNAAMPPASAILPWFSIDLLARLLSAVAAAPLHPGVPWSQSATNGSMAPAFATSALLSMLKARSPRAAAHHSLPLSLVASFFSIATSGGMPPAFAMSSRFSGTFRASWQSESAASSPFLDPPLSCATSFTAERELPIEDRDRRVSRHGGAA